MGKFLEGVWDAKIKKKSLHFLESWATPSVVEGVCDKKREETQEGRRGD